MPLALVASRALFFRELAVTGPRAPAFNLSASCALCALLVLEALEDRVVLHELLPMSPIPAEILETRVQSSNANPGSLISIEIRPTRPTLQDAWRMKELDSRGTRRISSLKSVVPLEVRVTVRLHLACSLIITEAYKGVRNRHKTTGPYRNPSRMPLQEAELVDHRRSLGSRRFTFRSRLREQLGQKRDVVPGLVLQGLREMPLKTHLTMGTVICMFTSELLDAALSPGFMKGVCEQFGKVQPLTLLWQPVPLEC